MAVHLAAVHVLREHPEHADSLMETLQRWSDSQQFSDHRRLDAWRRIVAARDWDAMLEDSEAGRALRKGSPLPFALSEDERRRICRQYSRPRS